MALLNQFLRLLEFIEHLCADLVDYGDWLTSSIGLVFNVCLLSYTGLLITGCTAPTAAILASVVALACHCVVQEPEA